jgi:hypothetical protein
MNLRDRDPLELSEIFADAFAAKQDAEAAMSDVVQERAYRRDVKMAKLQLAIEGLRAALKEAGDVIECYHKNTGIDLGAASRMPFYADTMLKIDAALKE